MSETRTERSPHSGPRQGRQWIARTAPGLAAAMDETTVAVLPVGAVEQHGPHLPLGTDTVIAEAVTLRALDFLSASVSATVLPTLAYAHSPEHGDFPGTVTLSSHSFLAVLGDIGASLARSGIRRILALNAHGGNSPLLDVACGGWRRDHGALAAHVRWPNLGLPAEIFPADEIRHGIHGGAIETAMMMALWPEAVDLARLDDFPSSSQRQAREHRHLGAQGSARLAWQAQDLNPAGAVGDARLATPEAGQRLIDHAGDQLAELIEEMATEPLPVAAS